MKSSTLKIIYGILMAFGVGNAIILTRIIWRAMLEGEGRILIDVDKWGEGKAEIIISGIGTIALIGGTLYFLKYIDITKTPGKKELLLLDKKIFSEIIEKTKRKFNL